jgi:very-short-patch-repair endonuclease
MGINEDVRMRRVNQTRAESKLWACLRGLKLGAKFRRQHPLPFTDNGKIRHFIADFYCHRCRLIIEVDGPIHDTQPEYDQLRPHLIEIMGIQTIRVSNFDIEHHLNQVLLKIKQNLTPI